MLSRRISVLFTVETPGHASNDNPGHYAPSDLCGHLSWIKMNIRTFDQEMSMLCQIFKSKVRFLVGFFEAPFLPYLQDPWIHAEPACVFMALNKFSLSHPSGVAGSSWKSQLECLALVSFNFLEFYSEIQFCATCHYDSLLFIMIHYDRRIIAFCWMFVVSTSQSPQVWNAILHAMVPLGENVGFILAQDEMFVQTSSSITCLGGEYRWNSHKIKHDLRNFASFLASFCISRFRFFMLPSLPYVVRSWWTQVFLGVGLSWAKLSPSGAVRCFAWPTVAAAILASESKWDMKRWSD